MLNRRDLFSLTPLVLLPAVLGPRSNVLRASSPPVVDATFPSQPYATVKDMVIASHGNVAKVRELVGRQPALAKAAIDWGYGDWEDALGAASHVGNREIAEFLIANGARPSIFSAAMLGQLDAVKAFVAAMPGCEAIHGPHSITLLRHALAGGPAAQAVLDYLKTLPGSDRKPATQPLSAAEIAALSGTYAFGANAGDRFVVSATNASMTASGWSLQIARGDFFPRGLAHLGDHAFYPSGATSVRLRFANAGGKVTVSVFDPELLVTAEKVG